MRARYWSDARLLLVVFLGLGLIRCADIAPPPAAPPSAVPATDNLKPIAEAFLAGDAEAIRGLVEYTITPCTTADGLGGPPKCEAGEQDGTVVRAFPVGGPEGHFVRPEGMPDLLKSALEGVRAVYAVYRAPRVADNAPQVDYWAAGEHSILFDHRQYGVSVPLTVLIEGGRIVSFNYHMGQEPADVLDGIRQEDVIVAPDQIDGWLGRAVGASVLGRWRVVEKDGMNVPNSFFWASMDYVEFRAGGTVLALVDWPPDTPAEIRLNQTGQYSLVEDDEIEFVGSCRHEDPCTGTYRVELRGDSLAIVNAEGKLQLQRVGPPGEDIPARIMGPSPSPTPETTQ
jgi:hypothetical protein